MLTRRLATLVVVLLSAVPAAAPASAQVDLFDWTFTGASSGSGIQTPEVLVVNGPDGQCEVPVAYFEAIAPLGGTLRVMVDFQNLDSGVLQGHPDFDAPVYILNGQTVFAEQEPISGGWPTDTYDLKIKLEAGDVFGLGVWSIDCIEGPGIATFRDLVFTPKIWSSQSVGLDPRVRFSLAGASPASGPVSAAAAGDVDDDGVPDFITGFAGKAVVRSGATGATLHVFTGPSDLGSSVAGAGDVDGDGHDDLIVGARNDSSLFPGGGSAWVYSGADGTLLYDYHGGANFDRLGDKVAGVGDVDDDGFGDFAIRVAKFSITPPQVWVISGATGTVLHTLIAPTFGQGFGEHLAGVGDVNADGHDDVGIGNTSLALVISGDTGGTLLVLGDNLLNEVSVDGAGDVDGDGHDDVLLGAPFYVVENAMLGRAQVFSGQTGSVLLTRDGTEAGGHFGAEVAGGRDLDGDGRIDIAVASPDAGGGGVVEVFDALDGSLRSTIAAPGPTDDLGTQLARMGDVDGDLQDDLLILSAGGGPNQGGTVRVFQNLDRAGPPVLTGTGTLVPGTPFALSLTGAAPSQLAWFVVGASYIGQPFLGGTLGPSPDVIRLFATNPAGNLALESSWPVGLPVGTSIWVQAWIGDPDAPQGYASTNAVAASQL